MKKLTIAFILALLPAAMAHEGHDHDAPVRLQAKKGGEIRGLENVNIELLAKGKDLKIFVFDKQMNRQDLKGFSIKAFAELPRGGKKAEELKLEAQADHLATSFDAKSAHRYTLILEVKDPAETHSDTLKFTIEPKK